MTQEQVKEEVVTFEVLTLDSGTGYGTVTSGTNNKITLYSEIDNDSHFTNTVSVLINDVEFLSNDTYIATDETGSIFIYDINEGDYDEILSNDTLSTSLGAIALNDVISITFEVTQAPVLSGVSAVMLSVIPIIFVAGILAYLQISKKED
ncbi:MAG: hypothetical protein QXN68_02650 [Thermoplasmata archaeon]